jgi:sulfur-oxidizing protein SoxZ
MLLGRLQVPPSARRGETFEIRVLVDHPMETGFRRNMDGQAIPAHIVNRLVCRYGGREVFSAELGTGMSANPYIAFFAVAESSGEVVVEWSDDHGEKGRMAAMLNVA